MRISTPKIGVIGAGSAVFSLLTILDIVSAPELEGSEIVLMDIDEKRLRFVEGLVERVISDSKSKIQVNTSSKREEALNAADFIILSIDKDRFKTWRLDWEIPVKHGIKQVMGECGGPGGLFHTLRIVPDVLQICEDMEDLCPTALLLNYSNPEGRICMAVSRYSKIRVVGLCSGIYEQLVNISKIMDVSPETLEAKAYGLNHFTWIKELRFKDGRDAYPLLRERLKRSPDFQPLCRKLFEVFGLYPSPSDNHVAEYLPYGWEMTPEEIKGNNWIEAHRTWTEKMTGYAEKIYTREISVNALKRILLEQNDYFTRGRAIEIIKAIISNKRYLELAVNIPNQGHITNVKQSAIVEVPAVIDSGGVHGLSMGDLPKPIAALCNLQVSVQELAIEAAIEGNQNKALQALLIDPVVDTLKGAEDALVELLKEQAQYLPRFSVSKND